MSARLLKVTWLTVGFSRERDEKDFFDIATEIERNDTPAGTEVTYSVIVYDADDMGMVKGLLEEEEEITDYEWLDWIHDATV